MYLVAIAWMYVVLMMCVAEATAINGTVLGAIFTFLLYGILPLSIVMYLMGTPMRRKAQRIRLAESQQSELLPGLAPPEMSLEPDTSGKAATDPVSSVREKT